MMNLPKEYLVLFNAITDAEQSLRQLEDRLVAAQQKAEELYIREEAPPKDVAE